MTDKVITVNKLEDEIFVKEQIFEQKIKPYGSCLTSIEIECDVQIPRFYYNPNIGYPEYYSEYYSELSEYRFDKDKNKHYQRLYSEDESIFEILCKEGEIEIEWIKKLPN